MILNIIVNRRHIIDGVHRNAEQCPIALAIREQYDIKNVQVFRDLIYLAIAGVEYRSHNSDEVKNFIREYDFNEYLDEPHEVQPISFSATFERISGPSS